MRYSIMNRYPALNKVYQNQAKYKDISCPPLPVVSPFPLRSPFPPPLSSFLVFILHSFSLFTHLVIVGSQSWRQSSQVQKGTEECRRGRNGRRGGCTWYLFSPFYLFHVLSCHFFLVSFFLFCASAHLLSRSYCY